MGTPRRGWGGLATVVALGLALVGCGGGSSPSAPAPAATAAAPRPNLVLVVADDLDVPTTDRLPRFQRLAEEGLTFTRFYTAQPLCGPSRAAILTGQYGHNNGVLYNGSPNGGFSTFRRRESSSLAPWLKSAGYRTALVGKYINAYPGDTGDVGDDYIPPGWDYWYGHITTLEDGRYYNYWANDNGNVIRHGAAPEDYSADVETKRAVAFIRGEAGRPEPIFLYLGPQAPHEPATCAPRHGPEFGDEQAPRVPSFDVPDPESPAPPFSKGDIAWLDDLQRRRMCSVTFVNDMIDAVVQALTETGRADNTYVLFTSDNGLLMGQHRGRAFKDNFYEEVIRVPLMVRGPGVPRGTVDRPAVTVDLAPTLLELAGLPVPDSVDGRSLAGFLRGRPPATWRTEIYVESYVGYQTAPDQKYGIRTADWFYGNADRVLLFDMRADPYQLTNLRRSAPPADLDAFERRARTYSTCKGASCP
jgi:N-acetylglucosamine-6-sulfatase